MTLLVMTSRPAAREESGAGPSARPAAPARAASARPGALVPTWSSRHQSRWISNSRKSAARIEEQDENHTVRVALDGQAGTHERWPDSVEHDALFAPDGQAMARRLLSASQMRFTFSPHNAAPVTATFEVAGLGELLAPVAKRCGR